MLPGRKVLCQDLLIILKNPESYRQSLSETTFPEHLTGLVLKTYKFGLQFIGKKSYGHPLYETGLEVPRAANGGTSIVRSQVEVGGKVIHFLTLPGGMAPTCPMTSLPPTKILPDRKGEN